MQHAPADYPDGKEGDLLTVEFTVFGIPYIGLSGGPTFNHNEAFSFQVCTKVQAETDKYRTAIVDNGRQESADGARINGGVSWQITSAALNDGMKDKDPAVRRRVLVAMMEMGKLDIAAINAAHKG